MRKDQTISEVIFGYCINKHCHLLNEGDRDALLRFLKNRHVPSSALEFLLNRDEENIEKRSFQIQNYAFYSEHSLTAILKKCMANFDSLTFSELILAFEWNRRILEEKKNRCDRVTDLYRDVTKWHQLSKTDVREMEKFLVTEQETTALLEEYLRQLQAYIMVHFGFQNSFLGRGKYYLLRTSEIAKDRYLDEHLRTLFYCFRDSEHDFYQDSDFCKIKTLLR